MHNCILTNEKTNQWPATQKHKLCLTAGFRFSCANTCVGVTASKHTSKTVSITSHLCFLLTMVYFVG